MKRIFVILMVGFNLITVAAGARVVQLAHYRLQHIETAVGINEYNPDGQIYDSFVAVMKGLNIINNKLGHNNETFRPTPQKERTYETRVESPVD